MYSKEVYQFNGGYAFRVLKNGEEFYKQESIPSMTGFKPIPTLEMANALADEAVEYYTIIDGQ